jgi:hypothetical protein
LIESDQGLDFSFEHDLIRKPGSTFRDHAPVDWLTAFGLFAVTAMLICYTLEDRSPAFVLAFAGACALGSAYGFLQGAWPFGLVEAVWAVIAVRRWWTRLKQAPAQ